MSKTTLMIDTEKRLSRDLKELLTELYHEERLTINEIANKINVRPATLKSWFKRLNIPTRSRSEASLVRFSNTSPEYRKAITREAHKKVNDIIDAGEFWLGGRVKGTMSEEESQSISERMSNNNPMKKEKHAMKMRISMESVLRERATPQESKFKEAIESEGYFPKFQHAEYKAVLDFAFLEEKVGIEIDGDAHYLNKAVREKDRKRDEGLKTLGWEIIRIPNKEVENNLSETIAEVIATVERVRNSR